MRVRKIKERVLIACNTLTSIALPAYFDHARFYYRVGRDHPDTEFFQYFARRASIDKFRNWAAQAAISMDAKWLMFIDDDMMLPFDSYTKLRKVNYDIVGALNYIRGYPFRLMAFKYTKSNEKPRRLANIYQEELPKPLGAVIPCNAIGTAVALIRVDIFKKTPAPWFITGPHNTEDIYFCIKAKEYVPKIKIGMHTGVVTGHLLDQEVISYETYEDLKKFYEMGMTPREIESTQFGGERGEAYAAENEKEGDPNPQFDLNFDITVDGAEQL
jgi:hypothetical protein